ncbi:hypothetical protein SAG0136_11495 [Streptococcus agalactiae LMG 14747]|uniref:Uncharacterized protein n=1 Tax=Streptococcus agalactiae LMG 14747 TaxID=1154860 RepID=V6Z4H7_STRAG|nr:hypothetical protein SAG0136_11495 [Streptococcus agalactiae LMG 14747]HEM5138970.1 hypothetical protein [Streptococcus suis]HEM6128851.1 hypothetical protein [Streptococcus suis]
MTEEMILSGLQVSVKELTQKLSEELTGKNLLAVQVAQLTEELESMKRVLDSDTALQELFLEVQEKLKEDSHGEQALT